MPSMSFHYHLKLFVFCDAPINPIWLYPNTELCADIPFMKYNLRSMPFDSSSSSVSRPASSNCVGNFGIMRHLIDVAWKLLRTHLGYISCPLATVVKVIGLLKIWNGRWREFFLPFLTFGFSSHTRTKSTSFLQSLLMGIGAALCTPLFLITETVTCFHSLPVPWNTEWNWMHKMGGKYCGVVPISIQFSPTWSKHFLPPSPPRLLGVEKPPRGFQVCRS